MALRATNIDPRVIEIDNKPIAKSKSAVTSDKTETVLDNTWAKVAFLVPGVDLTDGYDSTNRFWSSASAKFTDTSLGGNIGINSKPQFTRYADTRVSGRLAGRSKVTIGNTSGNLGMGRYYSEAIDDPSQTIYLRFGVPEFNSVTNFIAKAFDANMTSIARTGRAPSAFYRLGQVAGGIGGIIAFPAIPILLLTARIVGSFFSRPTSKYYTLKPTMTNYWSTVNQLVNTLAINAGILPKVLRTDLGQNIGKPYILDNDYLTQVSKLLPSTFRGGNFFDMYSIANRSQRLANQLFEEEYEKLNVGSATDFSGWVEKNLTGDGTTLRYISDKNGNPTLSARLNKLAELGQYKTENGKISTEKDPRIGKDGKQISTTQGFFDEFKQDLDSEFRDGSQFAVFKVKSTGSMSESFGNSSGESDISQKLNSASSSARQARFSFAEGNISDTVGSILSNVTDVAAGALNGLTVGFSDFFLNMAGSGYVDIPKYWQSSNATLPKANYSIKLISPYNNPISIMQNIQIPLAMLLAGSLPISTGKQSYTSPFLCQLYDRGRAQVKLGIIESLSITRGTSNLAFDTAGKALAIDVSFSVMDLSSVMHMPVSTGELFGVDMTMDEDNVLMDYLSVLAGQGLYSQIYPMAKAKLNVAKKVVNAQKLTSPAYWSSMFHESSTEGLLQKLTLGSFNVLEGVSRGSSLVPK